jgi:hypothetical protein
VSTLEYTAKMPSCHDVYYDRDDTVRVIRSYYTFLTRMYLRASAVHSPPEGGWPSITIDRFRAFGKTDEVIDLLRHLPYVDAVNDGNLEPFQTLKCAPYAEFADYRSFFRGGNDDDDLERHDTGEGIKAVTEDTDADDVPTHVVGLISGGRDSPFFLLDTQLGVIYWMDCPTPLKSHPPIERMNDDPEDFDTLANEDGWRREAPCWEIGDFFDLLKRGFLELNALPVAAYKVFDVYGRFEDEEMVPRVRAIWREHGWPDWERYEREGEKSLDGFRREECLKAVRRFLEENHEGYLGP